MVPKAFLALHVDLIPDLDLGMECMISRDTT